MKLDGVKPEDLLKVETEANELKKTLIGEEYYEKLLERASVDEDTLDLSKPFAFFNSSIRIGFYERINLLERETIQYYRKRRPAAIQQPQQPA